MRTETATDRTPPNIVERLRLKTEYAWRLGFKIRFELLDGREATWCEISGNKILFVDLGLAAGEQLEQIERSLDDYERSIRRQPENRIPERRMMPERRMVA